MPKGKGPKPPAAGEITAFGVDIIKQYPGQEQVDLSVLVEIPGSWFGGALTTNERRDKYEAQAVEFTEVYEFGSGKKATKEPAIRFICIRSDAVDDGAHLGFWMKLVEWNRYVNNHCGA